MNNQRETRRPVEVEAPPRHDIAPDVETERVATPPAPPIANGIGDTALFNGAEIEDVDELNDDAADPDAYALAPSPEAPSMNAQRVEPQLKGWARCEVWLERKAHEHRFWQKILSRIWLPLAAHSGLTMKKLDPHTFTAVLPFRRFNRNFYNAMAGAALLANSEIAAGMYLFGELRGKWTVVCKELNYRFLRPCFGPAIYRIVPAENIQTKLSTGNEFNINVVLEILQQVQTPGRKPRRVGRCEAVFHCTPKTSEGNRRLQRRLMRRLK